MRGDCPGGWLEDIPEEVGGISMGMGPLHKVFSLSTPVSGDGFALSDWLPCGDWWCSGCRVEAPGCEVRTYWQNPTAGTEAYMLLQNRRFAE